MWGISNYTWVDELGLRKWCDLLPKPFLFPFVYQIPHTNFVYQIPHTNMTGYYTNGIQKLIIICEDKTHLFSLLAKTYSWTLCNNKSLVTPLSDMNQAGRAYSVVKNITEGNLQGIYGNERWRQWLQGQRLCLGHVPGLHAWPGHL